MGWKSNLCVVLVVFVGSLVVIAGASGAHADTDRTVAADNHTDDEPEPPLADAGLDQKVQRAVPVYLDAGGSVAPEGTIDAFAWTVERPDGTTTAPACSTCEQTRFVPEQVGTYAVTVRVTASNGATANDTLYVEVSDRQPPEASLSGPETLLVGRQGTISLETSARTNQPESVSWYRDGLRQESYFLDEPSARERTVRFSEAGTHTVSAEVFDTSGLSVRPTHELTVVEPAYFAVDIDSVTTSGPGPSTLTVTATITNTGGASDSQPITLTTDSGKQPDRTMLGLDGGESETVSLDWANPPTTGAVTLEVASDDDAETTTVDLGEDGGSENVTGPYFAITIEEATPPGLDGETLTLQAQIENTGNRSDTQNVTLGTEQFGTHDGRPLTLAPDESATRELSWSDAKTSPSSLNVTVSTDNETASQVVTLPSPGKPYFALDIEAVESPVDLGARELGVTATVTNRGETADTQEIRLLSSDGTTADSRVVTDLEPGASVTVELERGISVATVQREQARAVVESDNDTASTRAVWDLQEASTEYYATGVAHPKSLSGFQEDNVESSKLGLDVSEAGDSVGDLSGVFFHTWTIRWEVYEKWTEREPEWSPESINKWGKPAEIQYNGPGNPEFLDAPGSGPSNPIAVRIPDEFTGSLSVCVETTLQDEDEVEEPYPPVNEEDYYGTPYDWQGSASWNSFVPEPFLKPQHCAELTESQAQQMITDGDDGENDQGDGGDGDGSDEAWVDYSLDVPGQVQRGDTFTAGLQIEQIASDEVIIEKTDLDEDTVQITIDGFSFLLNYNTDILSLESTNSNANFRDDSEEGTVTILDSSNPTPVDGASGSAIGFAPTFRATGAGQTGFALVAKDSEGANWGITHDRNARNWPGQGDNTNINVDANRATVEVTATDGGEPVSAPNLRARVVGESVTGDPIDRTKNLELSATASFEVPAGDYDVIVEKGETKSSTQMTLDWGDVRSTELEGDFVVEPGTLQVEVLNQDPDTRETEPADNAIVSLDIGDQQADADANGIAVFDEVSPGRYNVEAQSRAGQNEITDVEISEDETTEITIVITGETSDDPIE